MMAESTNTHMRLTRSKSFELAASAARPRLHLQALYVDENESGMDECTPPAEFHAPAHSLTRLTSASPGIQCADRRKRFRSMDRSTSTTSTTLATPTTSTTSTTSTTWDQLGDDTILSIMHTILEIPQDKHSGLELHTAVCAGCCTLVALLTTCKRMTEVMRAIGRHLEMELLARASTHIAPSAHMLQTSVYPYSHQLRSESRSADQLNVLRQAIADLAIHCANACCESRRNDLNRQLRKSGRGMLVPCANSSYVITSCHTGRFMFMASRIRETTVQGRHLKYGYELTRRTFTESSTRSSVPRIEAITLNRQKLGVGDHLSAPQSMRSDSDGSVVAFIRAVHAVVTDGRVPHSQVSVWAPCSNAFHEVVEPPGQAELLGAINAQDAWWVQNKDSNQLAVVWSTAYIHPMGTVIGANADNACYFIALYDTQDYEVEHFTGPFYGKVQTASPTRDGNEVAVLIRKPPMGNGPGSSAVRVTRLHDVHSETPVELDHHAAIQVGRGSLPPHPHDLAYCPSAVGLSPSGDCVVAVHRRHGTVIVEVLLRTASKVFVSVQTIDVTPWTSNGHVEPSIFDNDPTGAMETITALRLPYDIVFSPCGRFATILDKRATYGFPLTNHALVVLDMALRHERRGVRSLPLAPVGDVSPRSIQWTEAGMWIQPKFGTVLLWNTPHMPQ